MKFPSWLAAGQKSSSDRRIKHTSSPLSASSSATSSPSSVTSTSSLQSNLSLQTHPSLPSLNKSPFTSSTAAADFNCSATLRPRPDGLPITRLAVTGNLLYAASGHEISIYDLNTSTLLQSFNSGASGAGSVKAVAFLDGCVISAHQDSQIRVWKSKSVAKHRHQYKLIAALPTAADRLRHMAFPSSYVAVRRHRKILKIQHADAVSDLAVNGGQIYSVSWDRSLKIWQSSTLRCIESVQSAHDDAINAVVVSHDGTVYTGSADCRIRVWNRPESGSRHGLVATLEKHKSAVNALALTDDGSVMFSGSCDRSILVWEKEDSASYMAVVGALRGHEKAVLCLINVRDLLMSGSADRTVRIWRRGSGAGEYRCLAVLEGHGRPVKSLAGFSEGEEGKGNGVVSVCSGSLDGEIKVWRVEVR